MKKLIKPSEISGKVKAPSSKSIMQRAVAIALLSDGTTYLHNPSFCDDSKTSLEIVGSLGASVEIAKDVVKIEGGFSPKEYNINCGESGLSLRMFSAIASLSEKEITLIGGGSLKNRPILMIEEPLKHLGVICRTNNGYIPVKLKGPLRGGQARVNGSISSQFLSGLLIVLPCVKKNSLVFVKNLKSKPYIDLTLQVIEEFGAKVQNKDYERFVIAGKQKYCPRDYTIEGDWSGASFLLVAGALCGEATIDKISINSRQADKKIIDALEKCGADLIMAENSISVRKNRLNPFELDATESPDLFPPLVALASKCEGISKIKGSERLKFKESNRASALKEEFGKIGIKIDIIDDTMYVKGGEIMGGTISSHNDHRIAMALSLVGLASKKGVIVENSECIKKSYPNFFEDLEFLGAKINE
jgi:3-phosphoshikimate 1-carboxyvinyltransferase